MRVVLDTNVLLAAFATHGLCDLVLADCLQSHTLIISEPLLTEFDHHLAGKFKIPPSQAAEIIRFLRSQSTIVEPAEVVAVACRDPEDLMVLGTALAGNADCIVTGDNDLLVVHPFLKVAILSPRDFYQRISAGNR